MLANARWTKPQATPAASAHVPLRPTMLLGDDSPGSDLRRSWSRNAWVSWRRYHDWQCSVEPYSHWQSSGISAARDTRESRRLLSAGRFAFNKRDTGQWRFYYWHWVKGWRQNSIRFRRGGFLPDVATKIDWTGVVLTSRSPNPPRAGSDREGASDGNGANFPTIFA